MKNFFCALIFLGSTVSTLYAQKAYRYGTLPSFNFSKKLRHNWKLDSELESRQRLRRGVFGQAGFDGFEYERTDISLIASRKVGLDDKIAAGYMLRLRKGKTIHRFAQQYTFVQIYNAFRMAHRLAADETFGGNNSFEVRLRYRLGAEFALNGLFVDANEFYFKANHEYLHKFQGQTYDLEVRFLPMLGYLITDTNKVELGLDYRVDGFLDGGTTHNFWLAINWYIKI